MSEAQETFLVLLEEHASIDPRPFAGELARAQGISPFEARRKMRRGGGVVAEDLGKQEAENLCRRIRDHGIGARIVPAERLSCLPPVERFASAEILEEGLALRGMEGEEGPLLLWGEIILVNAALIFEGGYREGGGKRDLDVLPSLSGLDPEEASVVRENLILQMNQPPPQEKGEGTAREPLLRQLETGSLKRTLGAMDLIGTEGACWVRLLGRRLVLRRKRLRVAGDMALALLVREAGGRCAEEALSPLTSRLLHGDDKGSVTLTSLWDFHRNTLWRILLRFSEESA